jgi:hypothetical protein
MWIGNKSSLVNYRDGKTVRKKMVDRVRCWESATIIYLLNKQIIRMDLSFGK